jgi:hypothetical protein
LSKDMLQEAGIELMKLDTTNRGESS